MSLEERMQRLTTPGEVDAFLRRSASAAVFKAGGCGRSVQAFAEVEACLEDREDIPLGVIRVLEARAASDHVQEITGIRHASPQILFFQSGKVVFDRDNWNITADVMDEALESYFNLAPRA